MGKGRLEAFSDGVIAIIITIMVLELKVPHQADQADQADLAALTSLWPVFLSYVLRFVNVGIYWNNHHHLLHAVRQVSGSILWANLHLLFWLSLMPWATGWMGENHFAALPTALYGGVLAMCGVAYTILVFTIISSHGQDSVLSQAIGRDFKGKASLLLYAAAVPAALWLHPGVAGALFVAVALMWLVPDKRIERQMAVKKAAESP